MATPTLKPIVERSVCTRDPRFIRVRTFHPECNTQYVRYEPQRHRTAFPGVSNRFLTALAYLSLCANLGTVLLYVNRLV